MVWFVTAAFGAFTLGFLLAALLGGAGSPGAGGDACPCAVHHGIAGEHAHDEGAAIPAGARRLTAPTRLTAPPRLGASRRAGGLAHH